MVVFGLPVFVTLEAVDFYMHRKVHSSEEWTIATNRTYPNITICHPKFFNVDRLKENNISHGMASYITSVLSVNSVLGARDFILPEKLKIEYEFKSKKLSKELDNILTRKNMTLPDLFHELALRCEDFVLFCNLQGQLLLTNISILTDTTESCCEGFFHQIPFFSSFGTCYTSKRKIVETCPYVFRSLQIWMIPRRELFNYPEFDIGFHGFDALSRNGIFYSFHLPEDHPAAALQKQPLMAGPGAYHMLSLKMSEVDRSAGTEYLGEDDCYDPNKDNSECWSLDVPYSKLTCDAFHISQRINYRNCSMEKYFDIKFQDKYDQQLARPCLPDDVNGYESIYYSPKSNPYMKKCECLHTCKEINYLSTVTSGIIDETVVETTLKSLGRNDWKDWSKRNDLTAIHIYFASFEFSKKTLYYETHLDFLSMVGGWMGIIAGASMISFVEIIYFACDLLYRICKKNGVTEGM